MPPAFELDVTFIFIALYAGCVFALVSAVGLRRAAVGVLRGDGGDSILFKRIRIHGNFVENAPLMALTLLAAESLGIADGWLWAAVASFFSGRLYHWLRYDIADRGLGMALTTLPPVALGVALLYRLWAM
jgi:uncharacterized membrane protein YecN with MAPEG domain